MHIGHRIHRAVLGAAVGGGLLLSGVLPGIAPAAFADAAHTTLSVRTPAAVGFAGQPVAFSETIGNSGPAKENAELEFDAKMADGVEQDSFVIQYQDTASGPWKNLPMKFSGVDEFRGTLPHSLAVAAGGSETVHLRVGLPMGRPHNGDSNGGARSIRLDSAVVAADGSAAVWARDTHTIKVVAISTAIAHRPDHAVAGGPPVELDVVLSNPTPSDYVNLGNVLFTSPHATVQVRDAKGVWRTLPAIPFDTPSLVGHYLNGRDSSAAAGSTTTTRVRLTYDAKTPVGRSDLLPIVFVNEGSKPFRGTTLSGARGEMPIRAAVASPSPSPSASRTAPGTPSASAPAAASSAPSASASGTTAGDLAHTGSGSSGPIAIAAGALLVVGGIVLWLVRRRSSR
jgi:LPXTG-motif cell wall-anchored protein